MLAAVGGIFAPAAQAGATPDLPTGFLIIETEPPGLVVSVDGAPMGRTPIGPIEVMAGRVRVRVWPRDRRLVTGIREAYDAEVAQAETTRLALDLRPPIVLRTFPEPASLFHVATGRRDSSLGASPRALPRALLDRGDVRITRDAHHDTTVTGGTILTSTPDGRPVTVRLRARPREPEPGARARPLLRRRWVHWSLIGLGGVLSGGAALLRREGDRWYDRYLRATDPEEIGRFYDRTVRFDRMAGVSLGVGQVALTGGLFLLVTSPGE